MDLDKVLDDFEDTEELGQGNNFIEQDDKKALAVAPPLDEHDRRPDLIAPFEGCVVVFLESVLIHNHMTIMFNNIGL